MTRENRQWRIASVPESSVGPENFRWEMGSVPVPKEGEMLVRNLWLSLDPTGVFGLTSSPEEGGIGVGGVMRGYALSQVIESRHPSFHPGDLVHVFSGWEDYTVTDGKGFFDAWVVPPGTLPNLALGALGVTGMVAYFGTAEVAQPRAAETFVITGAAGGVGSIAVQIARILGLRVIGIAGGREKCDWLTKEAKVDGVIDHRSEEIGPRLDVLCPEGIDIFFDCAGRAPIIDEVLARIRGHGRVVLCGMTSIYLEKELPPGPRRLTALVMKNARMEGFLGRDYASRFPEGAKVVRGWIDSGQLRPKDDILDGLENAPRALARLFSGENVGKQLVRIADPPGGSSPR